MGVSIVSASQSQVCNRYYLVGLALPKGQWHECRHVMNNRINGHLKQCWQHWGVDWRRALGRPCLQRVKVQCQGSQCQGCQSLPAQQEQNLCILYTHRIPLQSEPNAIPDEIAVLYVSSCQSQRLYGSQSGQTTC